MLAFNSNWASTSDLRKWLNLSDRTIREYFIVVQGEYTIVFGDKRVVVKAGEEYCIPRGTPHAGEFKGGTRTIHAFGGKRAEREVLAVR